MLGRFFLTTDLHPQSTVIFFKNLNILGGKINGFKSVKFNSCWEFEILIYEIASQ